MFYEVNIQLHQISAIKDTSFIGILKTYGAPPPPRKSLFQCHYRNYLCHMNGLKPCSPEMNDGCLAVAVDLDSGYVLPPLDHFWEKRAVYCLAAASTKRVSFKQSALYANEDNDNQLAREIDKTTFLLSKKCVIEVIHFIRLSVVNRAMHTQGAKWTYSMIHPNQIRILWRLPWYLHHLKGKHSISPKVHKSKGS